MEIRAATPADLDKVLEIDGTIESQRQLHLQRSGEGFAITWKLEEQPLPQKLIEPHPLNDDQRFVLKQIVSGADDGAAIVVDYGGIVLALAVGTPNHATGTFRIVDVRVDFDYRRQGLASAMMFQMIQAAREKDLGALTLETSTTNFSALQFLTKLGFELSGLDTQRNAKRDPLEETAALFWRLSL